MFSQSSGCLTIVKLSPWRVENRILNVSQHIFVIFLFYTSSPSKIAILRCSEKNSFCSGFSISLELNIYCKS